MYVKLPKEILMLMERIRTSCLVIATMLENQPCFFYSMIHSLCSSGVQRSVNMYFLSPKSVPQNVRVRKYL